MKLRLYPAQEQKKQQQLPYEPLPKRLDGLDARQVAVSRRKYGENRLRKKKSKGFMAHVLENLGDPIIKILLVALGFNLLFLFSKENWFETVGIACAVLAAVIISACSESGSETAFSRLAAEAAKIRCRVIRQEGLRELPIEEVVVGDLVSLQAGDKIPADGFLLEGALMADQSSLNGETKEAAKSAVSGHLAELSADLLNRHQLFNGTLVASGQGIMRVAAVGNNTFYGRLADQVQEEKGLSPLKARLTRLAATISRFGYLGAALVAYAYLFNTLVIDNGFVFSKIMPVISQRGYLFGQLLHAVTLAVTVIVMAVPEGLPMMISVVLSANMKRMLKDHVLVRKLVGIETAGSLNILFTDKTGTLTKGRLQVTGFVDGAGTLWGEQDSLHQQPLWRELHRAICFNCGAQLSGAQAVGGNLTDRALLEYVDTHPLSHRLQTGPTLPFDPEQKFMATQVAGEFNGTLIKGALEMILPYCREYLNAQGQTLPFTDQAAFLRMMAQLQQEAARLIIVARAPGGLPVEGDFGPLTLIGVLAVRDDVRREACEGMRQILQAGIQVIMITGDSLLTAEAIARRTGLLGGHDDLVFSSQELNRLNDKQLSKLLPRLRVVARALPQDKSRLVRLAQAKGLVAGMTGDGVNDAPALRRADVGFAMGSGTEIAKEASDIVILDDNLLSIAKAIRYGRTIFKSIRKFIIFQLTLNFCAVCVSVAAPLLGVDSPITVIQMLWINMVMDTLASLAFAGEQALLEYMRERPKKRDEPIINPYMWREIAWGGLYAVCLSLWFLKSPFVAHLFQNETQLRFLTAFFALFMFTGIANSFCARTHHVNLLDHLAANKPFIAIMGFIILVQVILLYMGGPVFRTNGLSWHQFLFVLLLSASAVLAGLLRRLWYKLAKLPVGT